MIKNRLHNFSNINSLFNYSETLQGLRHSAVLAHAGALAQLPSSLRTSLWAIFGGFPALLIMCAAGDGGHATLILLPGSGKYPSSLRRTKTTKSWVWLQPPGLSAPTRTCPRVTACCSLLPIHPCVTPLLSNTQFYKIFDPSSNLWKTLVVSY